MSSSVETLFKFEPAGDFRNRETDDAASLKASTKINDKHKKALRNSSKGLNLLELAMGFEPATGFLN